MEGNTNREASLDATSHIPIAQLTPLLVAPSSRSIKAVVTLTWPYSSATGSVAYLLSEPDFRLRRTRGQVRVQFAGACARSVANSGIASGDEVILCLDGVEWINGEDAIITPGKGVEFELRFTERVLLQYNQEGSQKAHLIDVAQATLEAGVEASASNPTPISTPSVEPIPTSEDIVANISNEWSSPAFLKRARTSYGSMFDSDYDPFEDGTVRDKGRKRTRLSSTWRYSSRSPTPEEEESNTPTSPVPVSKPAVTTIDEGCQTMELDTENGVEALANFARQSTNIGSNSYPVTNGTNLLDSGLFDQDLIVPHREAPMLPHMIQTQPPDPSQLPFNQDIPLSPRLQPIPSDSLSLVSPLVASKYETLYAPINSDVMGMHPQNFSLGMSSAAQNGVPQAEGNEQDVYRSSPSGGHEEQLSAKGYSNSRDRSAFEASHGSENQYGRWQSIHAPQSSHSASHLRAPALSEERGQEDGFFGTEEIPGQFHGSQTPHAEAIDPRYPEPDKDDSGQPEIFWGPKVNYPEVPGQDEVDATNATAALPAVRHSVAMSRSRSVESEVADLNDSSDGEAEGPLSSAVHAEAPDESVEGEDIGTGEQLGDASRERYDEQNLHGRRSDPEHEEESGEGYDWGKERRYPGSQLDPDEGSVDAIDVFDPEEPQFGQEPLEGYDDEDMEDEEEEMSYDEETEDDEPETLPPVLRVPVVIDLLSSDDEDEAQDHSSVPPPYDADESHALHDISDGGDGGGSEDDNGHESENSVLEPLNANPKTSKGHHVEAEHEEMYEKDRISDADSSVEDYESEVEYGLNDPTAEGHDGSVSPSDEDNDDAVQGHEGSESESHRREDELCVEHEGELDRCMGDEGGDPAVADVELEERESAIRLIDPDLSLHDQYAEQTKASAQRPSLFSQMFSLDGANDYEEPHMQATYAPPATKSYLATQEVLHTTSLIQAARPRNEKLATPNDTQPSKTPPFAEISFSPTLLQPALKELRENEQNQTSHEVNETDGAKSGDTTIRHLEPTVNAVDDAEETESEHMDVDESQSFHTTVPAFEVLQAAVQPVSIGALHNEFEIAVEGVIIEAEYTSHEKKQASLDIPQPGLLVAEAHSASAMSEKSVLPSAEPKFLLTEKEPSPEARHSADSSTGAIREADDPERVPADTSVTDVLNEGGLPKENVQHVVARQEPEFTAEHPRRSHRRAKPSSNADATENVAGKVGDMEQDNGTSISAWNNTEVQEDTHDTTVTESKFTVEQPRRSHRRAKSSSITEADELNEVTSPATPIKPHIVVERNSATKEPSPMVVIDTQSISKGHDASIELALASLDSPSKQPHDLRKQHLSDPKIDLKLRLQRNLRTELSEFTALTNLQHHLNKKLDVVAVATTSPPEAARAKRGPRHYQIIFNITDVSLKVVQVQILRPYKDALPIIKAGDGILLRNFKVLAVKNREFALRSMQDEGSNWAVFKDNNEEEVRGPPVEFGDGEKKHIAALRAWYDTLDLTAIAKIQRANGDKAGVSKGMGKAV